MTISSKIEPGQIWLTYLHYLDHPEIGKVRPVVIVDVSENIVKVAAVKITSKPPREGSNDIQIKEWSSVGLRAPSTVRVDYVFKIPVEQLLRDEPIGEIPNGLLIKIITSINER